MGAGDVRDGRSSDFHAMRTEVAGVLRAALLVPGEDEIAQAAAEQIIDSVEAAFRQAVSDPRQRVLVAVVDGRAGGFLILDRRKPDAEVRWIAVLPGHHGTGLGHRLMAEALDRVAGEPAVTLVVTVGNERAIRFFRGFGFVGCAGGANAARVLRMRRPAGTPGLDG